MLDWISIFEGNGAAARDLASQLERHGLRCFVEDRQGPVESRSGGRANYSAVLVPPEQAERSREFATQWELSNLGDAELLTSRLLKVCAIGLFPAAVWFLGHLFAPRLLPEPRLAWLGGLWVFSVVVFAQIENRRYQRERIRLPDRSG